MTKLQEVAVHLVEHLQGMYGSRRVLAPLEVLLLPQGVQRVVSQVHLCPPTHRQPVVCREGSRLRGTPVRKANHGGSFPLWPHRGGVGHCGGHQGGRVVGDHLVVGEGAVGHHLVAGKGVMAVGEVSRQGAVSLLLLVELATGREARGIQGRVPEA